MRRPVLLSYCFVIFHVCFAISSAQCQYLRKPVRILNTKDGLPQSFVSGLVQDKDGFIWVATRAGLARFDGIHFKPYFHTDSDSNSLSSNIIVYLKMNTRNHISVLHESGQIDIFDPVTEKTKRVTSLPLFRLDAKNQEFRASMEDSEGNLWCGYDNGLRMFDFKAGSVNNYTKTGKDLPDDSVKDIQQDHRGNILVITKTGLTCIDSSRSHWKHFPFPASISSLGMSHIFERTNGDIVLANDTTFILFNFRKGFYLNFRLPQRGFSFQPGNDRFDYITINGIVNRCDYIHKLEPVGSVDEPDRKPVTSFLVDNSGLIWLGRNAAGLHQIDLSAPYFEPHRNIYSFPYDLLKLEFGIEVDKFSGWPITDADFKGAGYFFRSAFDAHHRLWIGLKDKVGFYDTSKKVLVTLPPVPGVTSQGHAGGLRGISFAPDGRLWVVGDTFVGYFDSTARRWLQIQNPVRAGIEPAGQSSVTDIRSDRDKLWIATSKYGLLVLNLADRQFNVINEKNNPGLLPTNNLIGLEQDISRKDLLWIGSYEGLICLNKKTLQSEFFTTKQGLPDNTIYSIQTDNLGFLWLSTNKGLCRFHPVTHQIRIFQTVDGLPEDEFNRFHHLKLPDGRLGFGGMEGWVLLDPASIAPDKYSTPVTFTGLQINYERVSHTPDSASLSQTLNELKHLELPYSQNTLTFEFAGMEFKQPDKLQYRYQLEGYNDKWIVTRNPIAIFTRLPSGHYTLKVNASNTSGAWSPLVRTLSIRIFPPFWRTWWAYTLYVLIAVLLAWVYFRYRVNTFRLQQAVVLKQKEADQLKVVDEMKSRFFSNITHEFRTPLSLIIAPLPELLEDDAPQSWKTKIAGVQRNAQQLLQLINQLLDMSKLEAGSMKVALFRGNIETFVKEVVYSFSTAAVAKNLDLGFHISNPVFVEYLFDANKLQVILSNLLSNSIKFTASGGKVELTLGIERNNELESGFIFSVQDSGIGIPVEKQSLIFNRFYQADDSSTRNYGGTGIGLALAKELAQLMKGDLDVISEPGNGATFYLRLSLVKATNEELPAYTNVAAPASLFIPELKNTHNKRHEEDASKPAILIVEDNQELNEFITKAFKPEYKVLSAVNGAEGWELAQQELPDVIISDWMMPELDGNSFCQAVKTNLVTNHIAFIMLTAKSAPASRIEGLQSQADDYIIKPFVTKELLLRVSNLLERQRLLREKLYAELTTPAILHDQVASLAPQTLDDPFLKKVHAHVEEKLDETGFGVEELAAAVNMSRASLHRKLKAVTGLAPNVIIRNYRLKRAAEYLRQGYNSSETAYTTGFDSPAYFTKCFREFYNVTPLEFAGQKEKL